jgi:shikimate dehydrogenase
MISAGTKLCGVIGDPVRHTLSPVMHNAAIAAMGLDYAYLAFQVKTAELCAAIQGMRALGVRGLNVTIPHKVAIVQFLDELDPLARDIGAVNTIVNNGGKLKGYNTDAGGFLQALEAGGFDLKGKKVILLGAGGAARAIGFAMAQNDAKITILNRRATLPHAAILGTNLERCSGTKVEVMALATANLKTSLEGADLLVNATSAGMDPAADETPVPSELLKPGLTVFDVVYAPLETRLLREAAARGCRSTSGLEMLVRQAALALELWSGEKAPLGVMREAALSELNQRKPEPDLKTSGKSTRLKTNIALIGFMGSGKSSVGKALAAKTGKRFIDVDTVVEKRVGKSVSLIFREDGEPAFRNLEKTAVAEAAGKKGVVIACGGGALLDRTNTACLKKNSVLVYLKASNTAIRKRVFFGPGERPLLASDNSDISALMSARLPGYEEAADITVDTTKLGIKLAAEKIIERLGEYEGFRL